MDYRMVGPAIVLSGLGCVGSSIGCGIGGMASHGVMRLRRREPWQIYRDVRLPLPNRSMDLSMF